ncbi:MAG: prepilin-type N-terminal cleavage/methylation domain-containing protein [Phycisphaeraceae bacterium]|nr:MAG: prepilin-type N-terminal cleavage/methylation domain-containing protein [Phycisphaeraceae bacterium]
MNFANTQTHVDRSSRGGFTLLELLIVIAVISLLITISLAVGSKVLSSGRETLTSNVVRSLETSLTSYIADTGDKIPNPLVEHPDSTSGSIRWQPVSDVLRGSGDSPDDEMVNSVGWYIYQMRDVSSVNATISGLATNVVKQFAPKLDSTGSYPAWGQPPLTTVFDGWGRPLRYVHPTFDGVILQSPRPYDFGKNPGDRGGGISETDIRELAPIKTGESFAFNSLRRNMRTNIDPTGRINLADSDGALCPNNRPYFYSAGADGDPSTILDNVYSTKPTFQTE